MKTNAHGWFLSVTYYILKQQFSLCKLHNGALRLAARGPAAPPFVFTFVLAVYKIKASCSYANFPSFMSSNYCFQGTFPVMSNDGQAIKTLINSHCHSIIAELLNKSGQYFELVGFSIETGWWKFMVEDCTSISITSHGIPNYVHSIDWSISIYCNAQTRNICNNIFMIVEDYLQTMLLPTVSNNDDMLLTMDDLEFVRHTLNDTDDDITDFANLMANNNARALKETITDGDSEILKDSVNSTIITDCITSASSSSMPITTNTLSSNDHNVRLVKILEIMQYLCTHELNPEILKASPPWFLKGADLKKVRIIMEPSVPDQGISMGKSCLSLRIDANYARSLAISKSDTYCCVLDELIRDMKVDYHRSTGIINKWGFIEHNSINYMSIFLLLYQKINLLIIPKKIPTIDENNNNDVNKKRKVDKVDMGPSYSFNDSFETHSCLVDTDTKSTGCSGYSSSCGTTSTKPRCYFKLLSIQVVYVGISFIIYYTLYGLLPNVMVSSIGWYIFGLLMMIEFLRMRALSSLLPAAGFWLLCMLILNIIFIIGGGMSLLQGCKEFGTYIFKKCIPISFWMRKVSTNNAKAHNL